MYWQLKIPPDSPKESSVSITVEADNWFTALKEGLEKHGIDSTLVSSLCCAVQTDQSVKIKDFISHRSYLLKPVDLKNGTDPLAPVPQEASKKKNNANVMPAAPGDRKSASVTPLADNNSIEDKMVQAFERMQDIYDLRTHDQIADFGLSIAMDLIQCETGGCMLLTPGKYELYVAAAKGAEADSLREQTIDINHGVVGFAIRMSAVVAVSEPENDSRFDKDYDERDGYETKTILCAPMQYEGQTAGAIFLLNSSNKKGFSQSDANTLSYIGSALAEYIEKSLPSRETDFGEREF